MTKQQFDKLYKSWMEVYQNDGKMRHPDFKIALCDNFHMYDIERFKKAIANICGSIYRFPSIEEIRKYLTTHIPDKKLTIRDEYREKTEDEIKHIEEIMLENFWKKHASEKVYKQKLKEFNERFGKEDNNSVPF